MDTTLMDATQWAQTEFGAAQMGDQRRTRRLIRVAAALAREAHGILPESFDGWAQLKAAYRLMEQPDVRYEDIIAPHRQRVRIACGEPGEYLLVEDTSELSFTGRQGMVGLGRIGDGRGQGMLVHTNLALRIERWNAQHEPEVTVRGLMHQQWWARTGSVIHKGRERRQDRLARQRESQRWGASIPQIGSPPADVRWTLVADRESDVYEVFERCVRHGWGFIIRANRPRALADATGLVTDALAHSPAFGAFSLEVRARPGRTARTADLEVRACRVQLRGPVRPDGRPGPRAVAVVEAREINPPGGEDPVHWVLLTDWPAGGWTEALRVVKAYARRWLIEEYHKALKTGTGIEHSQLTTADRITALLGILAVVAVRLLNMKLLATTCPDELVSPEELGAEAMAILENKFGRPPEGWTNRSLMRAVGRLGGFIGRRSDGEPGWIVIWRGWRKLMFMAEGFDLARNEKCG